MRVVDRAKERREELGVLQAVKEQARKALASIRSENAEYPTEVYIDRATWREFLEQLNSPGIGRFYGNEMVCGAFYIHTQIPAAEQFLKLAIRDRDQLSELVIEEFEYHPQNIPLALPDDRALITKLEKEAAKFGLDVDKYIRAIFFSRVLEIKKAKEKADQERLEKEFDNRVIKGEVVIDAELRRKIERVCGKQTGLGYIKRLKEIANKYLDMQ
jgi:predicted DNA binding CopG/RHH family protein